MLERGVNSLNVLGRTTSSRLRSHSNARTLSDSRATEPNSSCEPRDEVENDPCRDVPSWRPHKSWTCCVARERNPDLGSATIQILRRLMQSLQTASAPISDNPKFRAQIIIVGTHGAVLCLEPLLAHSIGGATLESVTSATYFICEQTARVGGVLD